MAKTATVKATRAPKIPTVATVVQPADIVNLQEVFKVTSETSEAEILRVDGMIGARLEFDFVYFKKLPESFVATLKAHNQKAYWLGFSEFESRDRRANLALHSIGGGVDPLSKILDRPRGRNNPLVRDSEIVQKRLPGFYVTWRIQGGEGDFTAALEAGFKVIRRPKDKEEEVSKEPFDWSGEIWKIPDGTSDPTSGEGIYNVMVAIRKQIWDDNLKAQSMASHNAYSQNKQQFIEGSENISKDMLGGKEKVIISDLDEVRAEEYYEHGGKRP
jgi:hypothetical protein